MNAIAALALVLAAQGEPAAADDERDPRTVEVLRQDCESGIDHRELTLFLNGTVRLRQGRRGSETMRLAEISRDEVAALLEQLATLDFTETDGDDASVSGDRVERCSFALDRPERGPVRLRYGRFGSQSLALARAIGIAADLADRAARSPDRLRQIPADYRPRAGDRLEREDGELFEVVGRTVDGEGVELVGVRVPLTLYVRILDLPAEFVRVVGPKEAP